MCSKTSLLRIGFLVCVAALCWTTDVSAQAFSAQTGTSSAASPASREVDLAVGYNTMRQNGVQGDSFWQQGGFAELSAGEWHRLSVAALVRGGAAANVNNTGVDVDTVTVAFGPRYTLRHARLAVFGEGLIGAAYAFDGAYPSPQGAISSTNSFTSIAQGGVDVALNRRFAVRVVQAGWQRTQFPNATTNVQNAFILGAGIRFRLTR